MKNTVIAAFAVALGLAFTASAHAAAGKTLAEIHGAAFPEASGWVKKDQCMKCHGSYEDLAKKTAGLEPNPHRSHLGAVNCQDCHKADKGGTRTHVQQLPQLHHPQEVIRFVVSL